MPKKQKLQFAVLLITILALIGAYFGVRAYNQKQEDKKEREDAAATISLTFFSADSVEKISYDNADGAYQFEKEDGVWKEKNHPKLELDQDAFTSFLESVGSITAQTEVNVQPDTGKADAGTDGEGDAKPAAGADGEEDAKPAAGADREGDAKQDAGADYGFDQPERTVTITTTNGTSSLLFGAKNEMLGQYYVKTSESSKAYLVETSVYALFDQTAKDFKAEEGKEEDKGEETEANEVEDSK